jgi:hypothetical protein
MDGQAGESVVRRRIKKNGAVAANHHRQRWSLADPQQVAGRTDRQSICFSAGFLSLSPARKPASSSSQQQPVRQPNNWRHSYACDGDASEQVNKKNKLDSIREEENDVAARSATLRGDSFAALSLSS